jgi:argininosuccinate lyase
VKVADAYSTGSSIMPQKRNPDVAELARGKSGRLLGNLVTVMTVMKGLPFAYNRDLQEDKEPIFDSLDTLALALPALTGMIRTAVFDKERINSGASGGYALATEVADYLVRKGVPFAIAHEITGRLVSTAEAKGCDLHQLSLSDFVAIDQRFDEQIFDVLDLTRAVASRLSPMGTSAQSVGSSISRLRGRLALVTKKIDQQAESFRKLMRQ